MFGLLQGLNLDAALKGAADAAPVVHAFHICFMGAACVAVLGAWFASLPGRVPRTHAEARMGWFVILGSLPIVVLGLLFQDQIETVFRSLWITATTLIVFGMVLAAADALGRHARTLDHLSTRHGVAYGFAQALALIPGVSRSGGTITAYDP